MSFFDRMRVSPTVEVEVKKFNPYHDPKNGRFTTEAGAGQNFSGPLGYVGRRDYATHAREGITYDRKKNRSNPSKVKQSEVMAAAAVAASGKASPERAIWLATERYGAGVTEAGSQWSGGKKYRSIGYLQDFHTRHPSQFADAMGGVLKKIGFKKDALRSGNLPNPELGPYANSARGRNEVWTHPKHGTVTVQTSMTPRGKKLEGEFAVVWDKLARK